MAQSVLSRSECIDKGLAFLAAEGFGRMHVSYYRTYDGILTVNYAAMQDDVVLYPDLVKLQISMRDGAIIGIEASNYYANHIAREIGQPALSLSLIHISFQFCCTGARGSCRARWRDRYPPRAGSKACRQRACAAAWIHPKFRRDTG